MDQHLFAEFREIKMVPKSLARSITARGIEGVLQMIPEHYTLNKGHVSFFYDKRVYLAMRYITLRVELVKRGVNFDRASCLDDARVYFGLPNTFANDYTPTPEALTIIRERIAQRIAERPGWYRYYGVIQK